MNKNQALKVDTNCVWVFLLMLFSEEINEALCASFPSAGDTFEAPAGTGRSPCRAAAPKTYPAPPRSE